MFHRFLLTGAVALSLAAPGASYAQPGKSRHIPKVTPLPSHFGHDPRGGHHHPWDHRHENPWTWDLRHGHGWDHRRDRDHGHGWDRHDSHHTFDKDHRHDHDRSRRFGTGFGAFEFGGFTNPYLPGAVNPVGTTMPTMLGGAPYSPYTPTTTGYEGSGMGYGGVPPLDYSLPAAADVMRAYGLVIKSDEEARLLREQTELTRLMNAKKRAETRAYIDSITPTASQREAKITQGMVTHALTTSNPSEIASGEALNVLLGDLRKSMAKRIAVSPIVLSENVLNEINVTGKRNGGSLGLLRNEGKIAWSCALDGIVSKQQRSAVDSEVQAAVRELSAGTVCRKAVPELRKFVAAAQDKLMKKVNAMTTTRYMEAKGFLNALDGACNALENGDAIAYLRFQKWSNGGKTVPDVVDYMLREGLQFASALPGEERAYRAMHSALAAYHTTVNPQSASSGLVSAEGYSRP